MHNSFISALLLLAVAAHTVVLVEGSMNCESYGYSYTLQPPDATACNPYLRGVLNLTCAVSGELIDDIQWFFRHSQSSQPVLLTNNSQATIIPSEFEGDYSVILTILQLSSENEGFYWCQGLIQHNDHTLELSQSDQFELLPEDDYLPIICPRNKALKSSTVRCAAVIPRPVPSTSQALNGLTSSVDFLAPTDRSSMTRQVYSTPTSPSTKYSATSVAVSPTSQPSSTDSTATPTTEHSPSGTQTSSTTVPPLDQGTIQLSDIILYAILGLLGCLVLLVFFLCIVISVLCCKKRQRGSEGKEAPYDQFSTESEAPPGTLTLKSLDTYPLPPPPPPYRLPLHPSHSDTMTSFSSGVYDEIHTISSQYGTHQPSVLDVARHHYQEIPAAQTDSATGANSNVEACTHDSAIGGESDTDTQHQLDFENLYDHADHRASPTPAPGSSPHQDSTHPSTHTAPSHCQSDSGSHEQPDTLREPLDVRSSTGDSSDFTNNTIQVTPPPEEKVLGSCLVGSSSGDAVALDLEVEPHVEFVIVDPSGEGGNLSTTPLPAIPENPYHVLEEENGMTTAQGDRNGTKVNREQSGGIVSPPPPPQILHHTLSLSEDEDYDRLVGPPHIYHILQNSPALVRPCIRECSPTSGYHRLDSRMEAPANTPKDTELLRALYRDDTLGSSTVSEGELFDDPTYNCSPKRAVKGGPAKPYCNGHSSQTSTLETSAVDRAADLSKYRGDYERDPMYMKLVQKLTESASDDSDHVDIRQLVKEMARSDKSASLPDITHTYQSLQTLTRDPLRNYEILHKRPSTVNNSTQI